jgi:hypothetical protein
MTSLNHILQLNAASCIGFGAVLVVKPAAVGAFLGSMPAQLVFAIGAVLLVNGAHLILASLRTISIQAELLWFSIGDLVWWLGSLGCIATGLWITTPTGTVIAFLVAMAVAGLGVAQLTVLGASRGGRSAPDHWHRIGQSWLSLPLWVKIWLFALNAVFLAAPAFLPWANSSVILIAYAACGPLLLAFAVFEGGLSRIMGIGHLVPWVPLLGWLVYWLAVADTSLLTLLYVSLLTAMTSVCLALDIYDILRWLRGERDILLVSNNAAALG